MRVIGILPNKEQVGALIDSLRVSGFEREDMIISEMEKSYTERGGEDNIFIKNENDSLNKQDPYTDIFKDTAHMGVVVAVETSKHQMDRVRTLMKENGAIHILEDASRE